MDQAFHRGGKSADGMPDVRSICAIGIRGQLGLNGELPWEGDPRPEFVADVERFFEVTRGHVLIAGPRTIAAVPAFAYKDRTIEVIRSSMNPEEVLARFAGRIVFVGGGPPVWDAYAPFIRHWDITRLPYDGPADRWFDPRWLAPRAGAEIAMRG
jgi:dihydromethanopterin reductase